MVTLLSTGKRLDELTLQNQRLRLCLMRYRFSISHVPGKELYTPDVLSPSPVRSPTTEGLGAIENNYNGLSSKTANRPATER